MRPINKGLWPTRPSDNSVRLVFTDWTNARPTLIERTGDYCHLCEIYLPMGLAVEHIKPKILFGALSDKWDNFLLICTACNSRKKNDIPERPYRFKYYWPHFNNTLMAFYTPLFGSDAYVVTARSGLTPSQVARADATINLYKLDQKILSSGEADPRYSRKLEIGGLAVAKYLEYKRGVCTLDSIKRSVVADGFFSMWLEIFKREQIVVDALLDLPAFKLDRAAWFDANNNPVGRNAGKMDTI